KRRPVVPDVACERLEVPGRVGELEDPREEPVADTCMNTPPYLSCKNVRLDDGELLKNPVGQVRPANLLPRNVVDHERAQTWVGGSAVFGRCVDPNLMESAKRDSRDEARDQSTLVDTAADISPAEHPAHHPLGP